MASHHQPQSPESRFHELFVRAVTHSERDPQEQAACHLANEKARWFYVRRDKSTLNLAKTFLAVRSTFVTLTDPEMSGNRQTRRQFPTLVSFVGPTTAGKSSLVRAIQSLGDLRSVHIPPMSHTDSHAQFIGSNFATLLKRLDTSVCHGPVTQSAHVDDSVRSTTYGVHLYKDSHPNTTATNRPDIAQIDSSVFFADAEGFGADEGSTTAEIRGPSTFDNSEVQEFPIIPEEYVGKGKAGIDHFYWRLLYTLTDVIVFVTEKDQGLLKDLVYLLESAARARLESVNASPKTLIIVRNRANQHHKEFYDPWKLHTKYMDRDTKVWEGPGASETLARFVEKYNHERGSWADEIDTNEKLYRALFYEVRCCYIPHLSNMQGHESEMFRQYEQLRDMIEEVASGSVELRLRRGMLLNVPQQIHLQGLAFKHLTIYTTPFDYSAAAKGDNADPTSPSSHMANFLRHAIQSPFRVPGLTGTSSFVSDMFILAALLEERRIGDGIS